MRLLFHTDSQASHRHQRHRRIKDSSANVSPCRPVTFEVKTGQKYAIYVKKVEMGRYVAVATPDTYTRKVRKAARKLLCQNCRKSHLKPHSMLDYANDVKNVRIQMQLTCRSLLPLGSFAER